MISTVSYRKARASDAAVIVAFQVTMAMETERLRLDPTVVRKGVARVFRDPKMGHYFVATHGGKVIASVLVLKEWSDWRNGEVWWIHSLYVLPEFRRAGVFRGLYTLLRKRVLKSRSARGLRLYVDRSNLRAQKAYRKVGMSDEHYLLFEWLKPNRG